MTIADWLARGKQAAQGISPERRVAGAIVLASIAAFGLGTLASKDWNFEASQEASAGQGAALEALAEANTASSAPSGEVEEASVSEAAARATSGAYVASKSGSKFYLPTCSGAKRIKPENEVWFATEDAAKAAGYDPAVACKGL